VNDDAHAPSLETYKIDGEAASIDGASVLLLVEGGLPVRDDEGECIRMAPGDVLVVAAGGCCRLGGPRETGEALAFRTSRAWAREAAALAGVDLDAPNAAFHVDRCGSESARRATRLLRELSAPAPADDRHAALSVTSRHLELLSIACAHRASVLDANSRREGARARARRLRFLEIVEGLAAQPLEEVSLATVAEALGTSERQASRLFRSELATTFRDHVARLRLERAKRLLRETDLPVIEVAAEAGWSSLGHFTTTFRRRTGMTPTRYRATAGPRCAA